jgi:hypothetical protein
VPSLIKINLLDSPIEDASKNVVVNTLVVVEVVNKGHELVVVPFFINEYIFKKLPWNILCPCPRT